MAKSDIEVINEMVRGNMDIRSSTNLHELYEVKRGGLVAMGVDHSTINDLMIQSVRGDQTHYCILYVINKAQFDELKKQ